MHHFFLERFLQPADWFESRLSYTRSVAASSMVSIDLNIIIFIYNFVVRAMK